MKTAILFFVLLLLFLPVRGQSVVPAWEEYIGAQVESGGMSEEEGAELRERWTALSADPLDLNSLTVADLEEFPFLNEYQIHHFFLYRHAHPDGFESIWVLKEINGWDPYVCSLLWPMVTVQQKPVPLAASLRSALSQARHEVSAVADAVLQRQDGYRPDARHPYRGAPWGGGLRWSYATAHRFSLGLTAAKDRGEPAFNSFNKGFDSYSAHLFVEGRGALRAVALGDYRVGMGYGLLINQSAFMGMAYADPRGGAKLRRAFTYAEDNFLRGAAASVSEGRWSLTAFFSRKGVDATVTDDGAIRSFYQTGLHRTDAELARRHAAVTTTSGASAGYRGERLRLGLNILHVHWGGRRLLRATGTKGIASLTDLERISHLSADYSYLFGGGEAEAFGELARASNGAVGLIQGVRYSHRLAGNYMLVGRYLQEDYWSHYTGAYAHYSRPGNEWGLMGKAQWTLRGRWMLRAFADYYGSFVPRYNRRENTEAVSWTVEGEKATAPFSWSCRLRGLADRDYRRCVALRLRGRYAFDNGWGLTASAQIARNQSYDSSADAWQAATGGKSLALRADYRGAKLLRVWSVDAAAFDADAFADRLYEAVYNPRYAYASAYFYGRGVRLGVFVRLAPIVHIEVESRLHHLLRRDAETIGTDGELIRGQARTQLFVTVRYR